MSHTISFYLETALFQMGTAVTTDLEEPRALMRSKPDPLLFFLSIITRSLSISQHAILKHVNYL
jgi:hypothetical protein